MGRLETGEVLAFASTQLFASECEGEGASETRAGDERLPLPRRAERLSVSRLR